MSHADKMRQARMLLERYKKAKHVFSSRLHTVMPCRGMRTPCTFVCKNPNDVRFAGLLSFMNVHCPGDKWNTDLDNPVFPQEEQFDQMVFEMKKRVWQWIHKGYLPPVIRPGLSIVTACMGREHHLAQTLPSWLSLNPDEIIIVAWGGQTSVLSHIAQCHPKCRIVEVQKVKRWVLSKAYNAGIGCARYERILKLDCDIQVRSNLLNYHNLQPGVFFAGNYMLAKDENQQHTNGVFFLKRKDFFNVGGFSEFLCDYGWDDDDLDQRLIAYGLKRLDFKDNSVSHLKHDHRLVNQPGALEESKSIQRNQMIATQHPWNCFLPRSLFVCTTNSQQLIVLEWQAGTSYLEVHTDTTTTTRWSGAADSTTRRATFLIFSGSATDEPPYFCTIS